jgi:hypothetical protein
MGLSYAHSSVSNDDGSDWNSTTYTASTSFMPWHRWSVYQNASYTQDLAAALAQSVVNINGELSPGFRLDHDSSGVFYTAGSSFMVGHGITLNGHFTHRVQWFTGTRYEDTQYGGSLTYNYTSRFLGFLYFGVGVVDTASQQGNDGAGLNANVGMNRKFGRWDTSADFTYSQNVQTVAGFDTTSSYNYGVSTRRKISNDLAIGGSFRGSHSGLVSVSGSGNRAESFSTDVAWRRYHLGASYSQSSGTAVLTSAGVLTATPIASLISNDIMLFDARSVSLTASTHLFRRLTFGGGYARFRSSTQLRTDGVLNNGERYNFRTEYRLRKFSLVGGFSRSMQDVSTVPGGPRLVNSYYLSLSRWFNVF